MASIGFLEFTTHCVANLSKYPIFRREARDRSISATVSHLCVSFATETVRVKSKVGLFQISQTPSDLFKLGT